jgi:MFS family permease
MADDSSGTRRRMVPLPGPLRALLASGLRRRLHRSPRQQALGITVLEGIVTSGMFAALSLWLVPLLGLLGASSTLISLTLALGMLGPALIGPFAGPLIARGGGARPVLFRATWTQAAALAGLAALAAPPVHQALGSSALTAAVVLNGVISLAMGVATAAWLTLMGTLLPPGIRGRFTSRRTVLFLLAQLAYVGVFALIALVLPPAGGWGLVLIFAIGSGARLASALLTMRQPHVAERAAVTTDADGPSLRAFLADLPRTDLGRWITVWSLLQVAAVLGGPFFTQFLCHPGPAGLDLDDHQPLVYSLIMQVNPITTMLVLPWVGRLIDRRGPAAVLRTGIAGVVAVPLAMVFHPTVPALLLGEVVSGVAWCMVNGSVSVLLLACHSDPATRSRLVAYAQMLASTAQVLAAGAGALLITYVPPLGDSAFRTIFLISLLLRIPVLILAWQWLPRLDAGPAGWRSFPSRIIGATRSLWRSVLGDD